MYQHRLAFGQRKAQRVGSQFAVDDCQADALRQFTRRRPCPGLSQFFPLKRQALALDRKEVVGAGLDVDTVIQHRQGEVEAGRLLHDVGAGQFVASLLEDLNGGIGATE